MSSNIVGQSNNPAATASEAAKLRAQGVTVFSIGVGSGIQDTELNAMATDPDNTHVFRVTDFSSLNTIKGTLSQKTCEGMYTPTTLVFCFHKISVTVLFTKYVHKCILMFHVI